MLNDFNALMVYLMTENYEKSIEYRENHKEGNSQFDNETKLEKIKGNLGTSHYAQAIENMCRKN